MLILLLTPLCIASAAQAGLPYSSGNIMLASFFIKQFTTPMIIPAALRYYSFLSTGREWKPSAHTWMAIPVLLLFAEIILFILAGTDSFIDSIENIPAKTHQDRMEQIIHFCSFRIFYGILAIELILWLIYASIRAIKKPRHSQLFNCTVIIIAYSLLETVIISAGDIASWHAYTICIILSVSIFILSYTSLSDDINSIGSEDIRPVISIATDASLDNVNEGALRRRFEDLVLKKQMFLKQGIRISDIASMLNTNRTYISKLVNNTYNMSFSDFINTLRIDYAKQYLLQHNEAKQSDIATACGFPNASAFNNIFKKATGVTPKIWLATTHKPIISNESSL